MSNDKLEEALRTLEAAALSGVMLHGDDIPRLHATADRIAPLAAEAAQAQAQAAEPVAWTRQDVINDDGGCPIGMDEPRIAWGAECPDYEGGWAPLYTRPQPAQDAKLPSGEDFRLHLGELTPAELRAAQAAFRYAMAKESGR